MKNKITPLSFLAIIFFLSCSSVFEENEITSFSFFKNSKIQEEVEVIDQKGKYIITKITDGNNLVFEFKKVYETDINILDSGSIESVIFEIEPQINNFSINDSSLKTINAFYKLKCGTCDDKGSIPIILGNITGIKNNSDSWYVDIDVNVEFEFDSLKNIKLSEVFYIKK
ncbi:hypothetical protein [Polaribacter porphyrae]|uniref:Uncharacterized protein n=1 Tax=Polaribacter porphyrae TaxID=1137780 RepID=A0A2S7WNB9_9FLAO|nr:hypothetical protein [Polaribacter porphyrae]PQJ79090.1 hypothetical protein BTO18_07870 [Polaribacter porphyrae]